MCQTSHLNFNWTLEPPEVGIALFGIRRVSQQQWSGQLKTTLASQFPAAMAALLYGVGMSTMDYVVGGMDHDFKLRLYRLLRALDDAKLEPGITSAFRDDYRQSIAAGKKAASDNSYHGGSRHGGYGHGLAADLVSVRGETRAERQVSSDELWKWIDAHGKEFGIGRPYLDKDPPHVGPIDGKKYANHRGVNAKHAANHVNGVNAKHADNHSTTKRGNNQANARRVDGLNAKPVDKSSLQAGANARRVNTVNAKGAYRVNTKPADKSSFRVGAAL
jgi:hypothetical protein